MMLVSTPCPYSYPRPLLYHGGEVERQGERSLNPLPLERVDKVGTSGIGAPKGGWSGDRRLADKVWSNRLFRRIEMGWDDTGAVRVHDDQSLFAILGILARAGCGRGHRNGFAVCSGRESVTAVVREEESAGECAGE